VEWGIYGFFSKAYFFLMEKKKPIFCLEKKNKDYIMAYTQSIPLFFLYQSERKKRGEREHEGKRERGKTPLVYHIKTDRFLLYERERERDSTLITHFSPHIKVSLPPQEG